MNKKQTQIIKESTEKYESIEHSIKLLKSLSEKAEVIAIGARRESGFILDNNNRKWTLSYTGIAKEELVKTILESLENAKKVLQERILQAAQGNDSEETIGLVHIPENIQKPEPSSEIV